MTGTHLRRLRQRTMAIRKTAPSKATGAAAEPLHPTQVEAARLLGVSINTYARWERDEVPISKTAEKLATLIFNGPIDIDPEL